jgi:hypothetical protein
LKWTKATSARVEPEASEGAVLQAKHIVFGIFKCNGLVYTEIIGDCNKASTGYWVAG